MDTLRHFVDAVWVRAPELHNPSLAAGAEGLVLSKPDPEIQNTRCLVTRRNRGGVQTDFYEFYWAHLMKEAMYFQVFLMGEVDTAQETFYSAASAPRFCTGSS